MDCTGSHGVEPMEIRQNTPHDPTSGEPGSGIDRSFTEHPHEARLGAIWIDLKKTAKVGTSARSVIGRPFPRTKVKRATSLPRFLKTKQRKQRAPEALRPRRKCVKGYWKVLQTPDVLHTGSRPSSVKASEPAPWGKVLDPRAHQESGSGGNASQSRCCFPRLECFASVIYG